MPSKKIRKIVITLTFVGLAISSYLTYFKLNLDTLSCDFGGCDAVQQSVYSELFGIPVAALGAGFYIILLILLLKKAANLVKLWLVWGIAFSTYLTYLELFKIKAVCGWCVTSFVIILVITFLYFKKDQTVHDISSS